MAGQIAAAYLKALQKVFLLASERMFCGAAQGIFWRPQENLFGGLAKHLVEASLSNLLAKKHLAGLVRGPVTSQDRSLIEARPTKSVLEACQKTSDGLARNLLMEVLMSYCVDLFLDRVQEL